VALIKNSDEKKFVPGVAPAAIQMGQYVGKIIQCRLSGTREPAPFHYFDKGSMATIGRAAAVVEIPWPKLKFGGFLAWLAWLLVHVSFLVQFENRVLVLLQWAGNYFTRNRSALLITHPTELVDDPKGTPRH
jgi:NADH dehydrogenase